MYHVCSNISQKSFNMWRNSNHSPTMVFRIPLGFTTPTIIQFYGRFRISWGKHFHFSIKIHFQVQRGPHFFHHMVDCILRTVLCRGLCQGGGGLQTTRKFMFLTKHRAPSSRANKRNAFFRSRCWGPLLFQSFHGPQHRQRNASCFGYDSGCNSGYNSSAPSGSFGFSSVSVRGLSRSSVVVVAVAVAVVVVQQFMLVLLVCLC